MQAPLPVKMRLLSNFQSTIFSALIEDESKSLISLRICYGCHDLSDNATRAIQINSDCGCLLFLILISKSYGSFQFEVRILRWGLDSCRVILRNLWHRSWIINEISYFDDFSCQEFFGISIRHSKWINPLKGRAYRTDNNFSSVFDSFMIVCLVLKQTRTC